MFKFLLLLSCCYVVAWARSKPRVVPIYDPDNADQLFEEFLKTHGKLYESEDGRQTRFEIFKTNLIRINKYNEESKTAVFGINQFADLTPEEFIDRHTGLRYDEDPRECPQATVGDISTPESFDWREKKKVARVKDQGQCGSCWAFSAVGNLEGQYAIKHNDLKEFSEQQLVDCDLYDFGCKGGLMAHAFFWLKENGGIESEEDYPYTAADGHCAFEASKALATVSGCLAFNGTDENVLKKALVQTGPLSIAVDATHFMHYHGGILDKCDGRNINHGVLLVGYGLENDVPYWIVKNSWSTSYGEDGYIKLKMYQNCCDMTSDVSSAVVN